MTPNDLTLIREKHAQLDALLPTLNADAWLIPCREQSDRAATLFAGFEVIGETVFVFTKAGKKVAVVTDYDRHDAEKVGVYDEVIPCSGGLTEPLRKVVRDEKLETFALNFSQDDPLADGLSYGLLLRLKEMLEAPDLEDNIVSSQNILEPLRARKSPEEVRRIREAIKLTEQIFSEVDAFVEKGMSERQIADFIKARQKHYGTSASFGDGANVMAGRNGIGHRGPSDEPIGGGDTILIDMGCFYEGYTSDIQRTYYVLNDGETSAPSEVQHRFDVGQESMRRAIAAMAPGKLGSEIDQIAREHQEQNGIKPYPHALGHQIGRTVHDGGTLLSPIGKRYGERGNVPLQIGEVYTVEPVVHGATDVDGVPIGVEQDVLVVEGKVEVLSTPQETLILVS